MNNLLASTAQAKLRFRLYRYRYLAVYILIGIVSLWVEILLMRGLNYLGLPLLPANLLGLGGSIFFAYWMNVRFNFKVPVAKRNRALLYFASTIYWEHKPAVLLIGRQWHLSYFLHEKPLPPPTSASFSALKTAVEQFTLHVEPDPTGTTEKPYQLVRWFGEDAAMNLRRDFAERWRARVQEKATPPPAH